VENKVVSKMYFIETYYHKKKSLEIGLELNEGCFRKIKLNRTKLVRFIYI